jgi:hypothetical protein
MILKLSLYSLVLVLSPPICLRYVLLANTTFSRMVGQDMAYVQGIKIVSASQVIPSSKKRWGMIPCLLVPPEDRGIKK